MIRSKGLFWIASRHADALYNRDVIELRWGR